MDIDNKTRVFGLPAEKGRWGFVIIGFIIYMCLGTIYSYSVFKTSIQKLFAINATESNLPFMLIMLVGASVAIIGGRLLNKYSPRLIGIIGCSLVALGWILSGLLPAIVPNIWMLTFSYSVVAGCGIGISYLAPMAVINKWFPDKTGLATGLAISGFGGSPFVTANVATPLIASVGPLQTFLMFGIVFMVLFFGLCLLLRLPAPGWKPASSLKLAGNAGNAAEFSRKQMAGTKTFWGLFLAYTIGSLAGLMAIGIASPVGTETLQLDALTAGSLVGIFAIFNAAGRPLFGWLTDRKSPRWAAVISLLLTAAAALLMLLPVPKTLTLYIFSFCLLWLSYGGWMAIAPATTARYFGPRYYSENYGLVFLGNGIGCFLGNLISGQSKDLFGNYSIAFLIVMVLSVLAIIISLGFLKSAGARSQVQEVSVPLLTNKKVLLCKPESMYSQSV